MGNGDLSVKRQIYFALGGLVGVFLAAIFLGFLLFDFSQFHIRRYQGIANELAAQSEILRKFNDYSTSMDQYFFGNSGVTIGKVDAEFALLLESIDRYDQELQWETRFFENKKWTLNEILSRNLPVEHEPDRASRMKLAVNDIHQQFHRLDQLTDSFERTREITSYYLVKDGELKRVFRELSAEAAAQDSDEIEYEDRALEALEFVALLAAFVGGVVFLVIIAVYRIVNAGSGALDQLVHATHVFGEGKLHHRVGQLYSDEFNNVAVGLDRMATQLEIAQKQLLLSNRDLEQKVAERTASLFEANKVLTENDYKRTQLIADVNHEMQTPLAILMGDIDVTLRSKRRWPKAYADLLRRLKKQALALSKIIGDITSVAYADEILNLDMHSVSLPYLVSECVDDARILAAPKNIQITLKAGSGNIDAFVDPMRIQQTVMIILDNAIKYTGSGGRIDVAVFQHGPRAVITVGDNGRGIAAKDLPRVFDRRFRGSIKERGNQAGAGLGLSIAKKFVDLHRGTIAVTSTPGSGTEIKITLPCHELQGKG
jgi:two-component system, OmpR family, sensor kinase